MLVVVKFLQNLKRLPNASRFSGKCATNSIWPSLPPFRKFVSHHAKHSPHFKGGKSAGRDPKRDTRPGDFSLALDGIRQETGLYRAILYTLQPVRFVFQT